MKCVNHILVFVYVSFTFLQIILTHLSVKMIKTGRNFKKGTVLKPGSTKIISLTYTTEVSFCS